MNKAAPKRVLIVEDEADLAALIFDYLHHHGFHASSVSDGIEALEIIRRDLPDFLVLDLMLPGLDGLSLCREVRRFSELPILILTAKVEEIDRLLGLEAGADDYMCKPFSPKELIARINTILRRCQPANNNTSKNSSPVYSWNQDTQCIQIAGQALDLTRSEYLLLLTFLKSPGQVFSRSQLLNKLDQNNIDVTDRAIDSHIKNLRKKIDAVLPNTPAIHSIYGLGYRFDLVLKEREC
ncbi:response regulator [Undibacterium sp. LX40W]|uniref:Response regulator n=1 Tax=Undibacterium nitidum TaxID=2762298 RepID=A0A923HMD6_9BURK|nr:MULTISPECIES: response regulator [Undibacterium]MBC3881023.1 response regulator [Undibacterium nitidum]MBC3890244.1 response regulator [Undibacterium sp. LX40W]